MNEQAPELKVWSDTLEVHSIFYTLQGEGPYAGYPAVFLRLAGCNLQCPGCDTEYTATRTPYTIDALLQEVERILTRHNCDLVVVTGGEPLRQNAIVQFLYRAVLDKPWRIQLETNGTYSVADILSPVTIVCSPKTPKCHSSLYTHPNVHFKFVVEQGFTDAQGLPTRVLGKPMQFTKPDGPIWLQSMDTGDVTENQKNLRYATMVCLMHGYRLSVQLHKLAEIA